MLFLLCGGTGIGFYFAEGCKIRLRALWELRESLQMLSGEIAYASNDLENIMQRLESKENIWSTFWSDIRSDLRGRTTESFSYIWEKSMEKNLRQYWWKEEDLQYVRELGNSIGGMDRDSQLKTLQLYTERLTMMLEKQQQDIMAKVRIFRLLGMSGGIMIGLFLL